MISTPPVDSPSAIWYFCLVNEGLGKFACSRIQSELSKRGRVPEVLCDAVGLIPRNVVVFWFKQQGQKQNEENESHCEPGAFLTQPEHDALLSIHCIDCLCISIIPFSPTSPQSQADALYQTRVSGSAQQKKPTLNNQAQQVAAARQLFQSRVVDGAFGTQLRRVVERSIQDLGASCGWIDPHPEARMKSDDRGDDATADTTKEKSNSIGSRSERTTDLQPFVPPLLLWRTTAERSDKYAPFTRMDFATAVSTVVADSAEQFARDKSRPWPWAAAMRFYHADFFCQVDVGPVFVAGLVLHGPNFPRVASPAPDEPMFRQALHFEIQRQFAAHQLAKMKLDALSATANGDDDDDAAAAGPTGAEFEQKHAFVPPPSNSRDKIRVVDSETCNMHSGIAEFMLSLAEVRAGDVLVDPFAGGGSLLLEAVIRGGRERGSMMPLVALGGDIEPADAAIQRRNFDSRAVEEAVRTVCPHWERAHGAEFTRLVARGISRCSSVCWDATKLPLRPNVADAVVSDMPFGNRCNNRKENRRIYPLFLRECWRILKPGGRCVLLTLERQVMKEALGAVCFANDNNNNPAEAGREQPLPAERRKRSDDDDQQQITEAAAPAANCAASETESPRPLFSLVREEFVIDMGGLLPLCFILKRNDS